MAITIPTADPRESGSPFMPQLRAAFEHVEPVFNNAALYGAVGASVGAKIDAAAAAFSGLQGLVVIPSTMAAGESLVGIPDNVRVLDLRGLNQPNFYGDPSAAYRKGIAWRARWTQAGAGVDNMAAQNIYSEAFAGGHNTGTKTNYIGINSVLVGRTEGQKNAIVGEVAGYADGDASAVTAISRYYAGMNAGGDEGGVAFNGGVYQGTDVFTATLSSVTDNGATTTLGYTSPANEGTRGEGRYLINTNPAKVFTGSCSVSTATPAIVTCAAGGLVAFFGAAPQNVLGRLFFSLAADDDTATTPNLKLVVPIASIDSDTQLTLAYKIAGAANSAYPGTTGVAGTARIYHGSIVSTLALSGALTVTDGATNWAISDTVEMPIGDKFSGLAIHLVVDQRLPSAINASGINLQFQNSKRFPTTTAFLANGRFQTGIQLDPTYQAGFTSYGVFCPGDITYGLYMQQVTENSRIGWTAAGVAKAIGFDRTTGDLSISNGFAVTAAGAASFSGALTVPTLNANSIALTAGLTAAGLIETSGGFKATGAGVLSLFEGTIQVNTKLIGSSVAHGDITIEGTSHADKEFSYISLQPTGGLVGIANTVPVTELHIRSARHPVPDNATGLRVDSTTAQAAGIGGGISFGFKYTDAGAYTAVAAITANKINSTSGNYSGGLTFWTTPSGSASFATRAMDMDHLGNIIVGTAALATNATDGFLYIPTCSGTPTGTPTTQTGRSPLIIDTTNSKLWAYFGGSWKGVTLV